MRMQLFISDLRQGVFRRLVLFLPIVVLAAFSSIQVYNGISDVGEQIPLAAFFLNALKGSPYLPRVNIMVSATGYLLLNAWIMILVANYAHEDMTQRGIQVFTRCGQKYSWWLSKCVWNLGTVLAAYFALFSTCLVLGLILGDLSADFTLGSWLCLAASYMDVSEIPSAGTIAVWVLVLPLLTSFALSMVQMLISILTEPIYGGIFTVCILTVSGVTDRIWWLPGNYLMLTRTKLLNPEGLEFYPAVILDLVLIVGSILAGIVFLRKKDIL